MLISVCKKLNPFNRLLRTRVKRGRIGDADLTEVDCKAFNLSVSSLLKNHKKNFEMIQKIMTEQSRIYSSQRMASYWPHPALVSIVKKKKKDTVA